MTSSFAKAFCYLQIGLVLTCALPHAARAEEAPPSFVIANQYVVSRPFSSAAARSHSGDNVTSDIDLLEVTREGVSEKFKVAAAHSSTKIVRFDKKKNLCPSLQKADRTIALCSPNFVRFSQQQPNDPYFPHQWALQALASTTAEVSTDAAAGWDLSSSTQQAIVAVIDGGVDTTDPDLAPSLWVNDQEIPGNNIDDDGNGFIDDIHGIDSVRMIGDPSSDDTHGSHVAGIIGAQGNNGVGTTGIAWNAKIIAIRASDNRGYFTTHAFARGVDYLVNLRVQRHLPIVAVNGSFGGYSFSQIEYAAVQKLQQAGIILVAAAGNEANDNDVYPLYPASYSLDNIISVAAADHQGALAYFSNFGLMSVDIAAPGVDILSTIGKGRYSFLDGTSMAAPFVTGAISLAAGVNPQFDYHQLRGLILDSGLPLGTFTGLMSSARMLNLRNLLLAAGSEVNASAIKINRKAQFSVDLGNKITDVRRGAKTDKSTLIRLTAKNPDEIGSAPAMIFVGFAWNGFGCPHISQVDHITQSDFSLSVSLQAARGKNIFSAQVFNGDSEGISSDSIMVRGVRPAKNTPRTRAYNKSVARKMCQAITRSLVIN